MSDKKEIGKSTKSIWGGEQDYDLYERSTQVPVVHSVSFGYKDIDTWHKAALGLVDGHIYSRNTNPTVRAFEDKVKELENAEAATSFSSGMAAISNTLGTFLKSGDRIVSIKDSYGGTNVIFNEFLPPLNIDVCLCETHDEEQIKNEILNGCKILYLETPTNPTIKITNIKKLSDYAKQVGALVVVDNTFATPINQNPLTLGADIVLHSASKYLGGHADALGGVICGDKSLVEKVYHYREINGATLAPM
ncbi:aminotransferase class I/II-fold pyridoxal phosphate-dependent enzyme, partial [archaeon]|nr:aminotransferase class I/II-fold pyridoxal phosphate-dependent enzyme [archaeon]